MAESKGLPERTLRKRVSSFLTRKARGRERLAEALEQIGMVSDSAFFFGGFMRELLLHGGVVQPRDIDIVVSGAASEILYSQFKDYVERRTRFGGLSLRVDGWRIDLWPLEETWAFRSGLCGTPAFSRLPSTTFLNLEAIVVEVATRPGRERNLYSRGFFEALASKVLEVNLEPNPYPELAIVRSLVTAANLRFRIGPKLLEYIVTRSEGISTDLFMQVQRSHYGKERRYERELSVWLRSLKDQYEREPRTPASLPPTQGIQLGLWESANVDLWPARRNV
jgi:hypothetical protein